VLIKFLISISPYISLSSFIILQKEGIILLKDFAINQNYGLLIDPKSVFWTIISKEKDLKNTLNKEILPLYEKVNDKLNKDMEKVRFASNLSAIYINPINKCNANCRYCYIPMSIRKDNLRMSKEQLEYILEKINRYFSLQKSLKKPVIVFHSTEPLLMKKTIFDIILKYNQDFFFGIQTNAILVEEEDVEFLKKYRVSVGISLDSHIPQINNKLRKNILNGGNFDKAIRAIEWFDGYEGLNIITTITNKNVEYLAEFVKFLHGKKISAVLLNPVRTTRKAILNLKPEDEVLTKYFIKAVDLAIELSQTTTHRITIANFSNLILGIIAPQARRLMCDISPCGAGRIFFAITTTGDVIPCGEFIKVKNKFCAGNIFESSIENLLNSSAFKNVRARIVEEIEECKECIFMNICGAPCPAESFSINKNMYLKSPYCEFYKEIITYAFKLIAEDKIKYILRKEALEELEYEYKLQR
jgi:uncharacterized protein